MILINFTLFPNIVTKRLSLRQLKIEDENEILVLRSDGRILKYLDIPISRTIDDARKFIEKINNGLINNEWIYWGIALKNEPKLIGTICLWNISKENLKADIGYVVHPDYQKMGIMQEAVIEVINYGFETMKLNCIDADVDPKNLESIKLLEKNKFEFNNKFESSVRYTRVKNRA